MRLRNKISLITGASRGIGRAIAVTFAKEGSDIIVNYSKNRDKAEEVVNEICGMGKRAFSVHANVENKDEVFKMVDEALKEFGKIDILINNAGIICRSSGTPWNILKASKEEWTRTLGVNLLGTYYCIQAVAPHMVEQRYGKIVNISSSAGIGTVIGGSVAYAPSKTAVIMLAKKLAYELGPYNINVNAIAPGVIRTEFLSVGRSEEELKELFEQRVKSSALRRVGEPQDIANVALFLASDESSYMTGQAIVVDGGKFDYLTHSF